MSDLNSKTFYPLILKKDGSISRTDKPVVLLEDAQKLINQLSESDQVNANLAACLEQKLKRIRQIIKEFQEIINGVEIDTLIQMPYYIKDWFERLKKETSNCQTTLPKP